VLGLQEEEEDEAQGEAVRRAAVQAYGAARDGAAAEGAARRPLASARPGLGNRAVLARLEGGTAPTPWLQRQADAGPGADAEATAKKEAFDVQAAHEGPGCRGPTLRAGIGNQFILRALASGPHLNGARVSAARISGGVRAAGVSGSEVPHRCAACASQVEDEAPLRVDSDNEDDSLPYPRAVEDGDAAASYSDAGTPAPAPPVFPPNPPAPAASCCDQALNKKLDKGDWGGIICCKNKKNVCVWQSNINKKVKNSKAQGIVGKCVREHEKTHVDQVDCTGADVERPPFKKGVDPKQAECDAYKVEAQCYKDTIDKCGTDSDCKKEVQHEWDFAKKQIKKYC
jgi:hypothetical protein